MASRDIKYRTLFEMMEEMPAHHQFQLFSAWLSKLSRSIVDQFSWDEQIVPKIVEFARKNKLIWDCMGQHPIAVNINMQSHITLYILRIGDDPREWTWDDATKASAMTPMPQADIDLLIAQLKARITEDGMIIPEEEFLAQQEAKKIQETSFPIPVASPPADLRESCSYSVPGNYDFNQRDNFTMTVTKESEGIHMKIVNAHTHTMKDLHGKRHTIGEGSKPLPHYDRMLDDVDKILVTKKKNSNKPPKNYWYFNSVGSYNLARDFERANVLTNERDSHSIIALVTKSGKKITLHEFNNQYNSAYPEYDPAVQIANWLSARLSQLMATPVTGEDTADAV